MQTSRKTQGACGIAQRSIQLAFAPPDSTHLCLLVLDALHKLLAVFNPDSFSLPLYCCSVCSTNLALSRLTQPSD
jgi:hypothetical protein